MTIDEAARFKQRYWALESKYNLWPPPPCNKLTKDELKKMDAEFVKERDALFSEYGVRDDAMIRMTDFMSVSFDFKPDLIAKMVESVSNVHNPS